MKHILFVDDDQAVLDGLRDMLRKQRQRWVMTFVSSGEQALAHLETNSVDLIVSDMRMPGMDGVALLTKVKALYPETARIVLSGYAEREAVIGALPVAHQFLSKPCSSDTICAVIERVCGLNALLQDLRVRRVIGSLSALPSLPQTYWEITKAAQQPDVTLSALGDIVEKDPAITIKLLQLVNSSYFGLAHAQTSVRQSVSYLGTALLKGLALTAHVFSTASIPEVAGFSLEALQQHSVLVSRLARRLLTDRTRAETAFTAALVHDIGKIVLAISLPERYAEVLRAIARTGRPDHVEELEVFGVTHAEVGAYLLGLWGLPLDIVEAVAYHHHPENALPTDTLIALHVADALTYPPAGPTPDASRNGRLQIDVVENSPFGPELTRWRILAENELFASRQSA
ncbi:MAG: response regulator [Gemmatimonas sp.]